VEAACGAVRAGLAWAGENAPGRRIWALEGTGSFAAGLVVFLLDAAIRAARKALSRDE